MNTPNTLTPYAELDPGTILDAVESLGFRCSGGLSALNSFENRVYQLGMDDAEPIIVKFYRPYRWTDEAIIEEHEFALELDNQEIPVVAPMMVANTTLHKFKDFRFAIFPRKSGRPLELDNLDHLEWMGRFIGRLHAIGACKPFQHRIRLTIDSYGREPYQFLLDNHFIPEELKYNYCYTMDALLEKIARRFERAGTPEYIRLHGDCHAGNVLWNSAGPIIVDLDDCLMGPAIQDLWMLLSGNAEQMKIQLDRVLDGYCEFYDYQPQELHLIETLRALRMIHYTGWLAKRWSDPAFPLNFPWFNTPRYWQDQLVYLNEQSALLDFSDDEV